MRSVNFDSSVIAKSSQSVPPVETDEKSAYSEPLKKQIGPPPEEGIDKIETVDLSDEQVYSFTTPVSFSYFGEQSNVTSWRELYINCVRIFLDDYPSVIKGIKGSSIIGKGRVDVGDTASFTMMFAPRKISDDIYVETNYSATDLMKRLRQLIDMCNMDFENLQISFKRQSPPDQFSGKQEPVQIAHREKSTIAGNTSVPVNDSGTIALQFNGETNEVARFVHWMLINGMAKASTNGYVSSLRQVEEFAKKKGYLAGNISSIVSSSKLKGLQKQLNNDAEFVSYNLEQHYRFNTALKKYIEYCSDVTKDPADVAGRTKSERTVAAEEKTIGSVPPEVARNYTSLLRDEFPDGLRQNIIHVKKFIQQYEERFGAIDATRDNLLDQLKQIGVVRDERIFPRQDSGQKSLTDEIYEAVSDVFQGGGTCVYLSKILERYGQPLGEQLGIYNEEALQAILLENNPSGFLFRYGYICDNAEKADSTQDVLRFVQSHHEPVNYDVIQAALWYLPMDRIKHALLTTASLVNVEQKTYFYAPNLPINANELQTLTRVMNEEIDAEGFLVGKDLKRLIDQYCPSAAINLANMKDWAIRNCLGYILRDQFEFTGALISRKGHPLSAAEAYQDFCRQHETLTLEQLKEFSTEINLPIYWDEVLSIMVRTSANELRRSDGIHFHIKETDAALDTLCIGDYIPLHEIRLYLQFPSIEVPWNGFVLESYLRNCSELFQLFQISVSNNSFYGVVVRRKSEFQTYEQVIVDMLARSTEWKNENDALELLVAHGFQAQRRYANFSEVIRKALLLRERIENKKK